MKYFLFFLLLLVTLHAFGGKRRHRGEPRTEVGLMNNLIGCLSNKDTFNYYYLFPPFDTLWAFVMHNPDHSPEATRQLNNLKEHPRSLLQFDPMYNPGIMSRFLNVLNKGEDSGIHWNSIVMQRYELSREVPSRDLIGYSLIAPERFKGYMFVRDMLGRHTFCISVTEIQKIRGYFFGGQVLNILEASGVDQFIKKEQEEKEYFEWLAKNKITDSAHADSIANGLIDTAGKVADTVGKGKKNFLSVGSATEEDTFKVRREIVDRRYYEGKFDEEIPVKLFIRYMKDLRTGLVSGYDGLYKFGDQVNYVKLHITRDKDGKWLMEDDPPIGTLELELKNKIYTGSWTNNENQTGYDVELIQTDVPERKIEQLDNILEKGLSGSVDETVYEKKDSDKADKPDKEKDKNKDSDEDKPKKKKPRSRNDDD
jgi:hypothetical protein